MASALSNRNLLPAVVVLLAWAEPSTAQWAGAQLLNDASENGAYHVKEPRLVGAAGGGFHAIYGPYGLGAITYRRFLNGTLGPRVGVHSGYSPNTHLAEALNGDIHITWENWVRRGTDSGTTPEVGWSVSTNGGIWFQPSVEISTGGWKSSKFPQIAPLGMSGDSMLTSWLRTSNKTIYHQVYDGTNWTSSINSGYGSHTEHQVTGIGRSPVDGSIYRAYGRQVGGVDTPMLRRFNGSAWEPEITIHPDLGFFARLTLAVNTAGQVMVVWDRNDAKWSKLYSPGTGWGPLIQIDNDVYDGNVVAIPGTTQFYVGYVAYKGDGYKAARGKLWNGSSWGASEHMSATVTGHYTPNCRVAAGSDGTMYAVWESWWSYGSYDAPRAYYAVRSPPPPLPTGTLAGVVRDQFGTGVSGAGITTSGASATQSGSTGAYSLTSPAGTYHASAMRAGYATQTHANVVVTAGQTTTLDFVISGQPPEPVSSLTVVSQSTVNTLSWVNPSTSNFSGTRVVCKVNTPPTGPDDGIVLVDGPASPGTQQHTHSGLTNGQSYHYRAYAYFLDANRHYAAPASASGIPAVAADFDRDGDVDQSDFAALQLCLTGPSVSPSQGCMSSDFSGDLDVDQQDLELFLACMSGPGLYANPSCMP